LTRSPLGVIGAVLGFLGVALGAFGAHALAERLGPQIQTWQTAAHYQLVHAVALLVVASLLERQVTRAITVAGWMFAIGTVLFSGSLYLLVLTGQHAWGAVTPFGGVCYLTGWLCLAVGFARRSR